MKFLKLLSLGVYGVGLYQITSPLVYLASTYYNQYLRTENGLTNGERLRLKYSSFTTKNFRDSPQSSYVMITGSSDGIGRVTALQMVKYGFNLVLVSRSQGKLEAVKDECLKINPNVRIGIVPFDFSKDTQYSKIFEGFEKDP